MFLRPTNEERKTHVPEFTVLHAPEFQANPEIDGTQSSTFIIVNLPLQPAPVSRFQTLQNFKGSTL
jgi:ATP-dependent phosphoenolpyruvate carboxykinase